MCPNFEGMAVIFFLFVFMQVSQVPAMVADFDRWASSFFRSPEELFARQIVTLELRNMIDGSNGRLHEMDSVAAMLEKELAPRPPSLRAEQFMDIALQTKQWSKPEAELHKMFREILVDTRTMHGQVRQLVKRVCSVNPFVLEEHFKSRLLTGRCA